MNKKQSRKRRSLHGRAKIRALESHRLCVHKTPKHIYVQLVSPCRTKVLASASTLDKAVRGDIKYGGNQDAATKVGKLIAERALKAGVKTVAFDRSGFKFHGRVKALADAAREGGLEF